MPPVGGGGVLVPVGVGVGVGLVVAPPQVTVVELLHCPPVLLHWLVDGSSVAVTVEVPTVLLVIAA
jgi:hypothetical protein